MNIQIHELLKSIFLSLTSNFTSRTMSSTFPHCILPRAFKSEASFFPETASVAAAETILKRLKQLSAVFKVKSRLKPPIKCQSTAS